MIDPRTAVVEKRLSRVARVIGICSAKGGVGKTMCTTVAGLALAGSGKRAGILDLDLQGASAHVFLGIRPGLPQEREGIVPLPVVDNLTLMSAAAFTGERGLALRGPAVTDAMLELLAVTQWGALDCLLIDMPPGIGEEVLDLARLVPRLSALVVSTPAIVSIAVVERLLDVLRRMRVRVPGIVANMVRNSAEPVRDLARRTGLSFAGEVPYEPALEEAVGDPIRLAATGAAAALLGALRTVGLD